MALAVAVDPELAAIQGKFFGRTAESQREVAYLVVALKLAEESYLQYQAGLLADQYWQTRAEFALSNLESQFGRDMYYDIRDGGVLAEEFVTWFDEAIDERFSD